MYTQLPFELPRLTLTVKAPSPWSGCGSALAVLQVMLLGLNVPLEMSVNGIESLTPPVVSTQTLELSAVPVGTVAMMKVFVQSECAAGA